MKEITEILRTEGILSQGFGISPKILYRDRRLTPEAKAIYGYIASFAGNGNSAFPSRDIMLDELGMSSKRYYKHFSLLLQCGYITITKQRDKFGSFDRNIYTIVSNPVSVETQQNHSQASDKAELRKSALKEKTRLTTDSSEKRKAGRSADKDSGMADTKQRGEEQALMSETEKVDDWLRTAMAIDEISQQQPEDKKYLEKIYMAALDMAESEQIKIGGTIKSRAQVAIVLNNLNADATRTVLFKYKEILKNKNYKIKNVKAFLQTVICNSFFDMDTYMEQQQNAEEEKYSKQKKEQEEERKREEKETKEEIYRKHPILKELDVRYVKNSQNISKAILSGDYGEKLQLLKEKELLVEERENYLSLHGLSDLI